MIALWRLLMVPEQQCFIVTPFPEESVCWVENAEAIISNAEPTTHDLFRFATNKTGICLTADKGNMGIVTLEPGMLALDAIDRFMGTPTTLVMAGLDRIATDYIAAAARLSASCTANLWTLILPQRQ